MAIEYIDETHTYLNSKGIIIPSVSALVGFKFKDQYKDIPESVLKKKARYGSKVHEYIERFVKKEFTLEELQKKRIDPDVKLAVEEFERCRKMWCFFIKDVERMVDWNERYAGRLDLLTEDNYVIDIKTTQELHTDWLRYQLSLYAMALGIKQDFHYAMWLAKGKMGKVITIPTVPEEELRSLVKEYEQANSTGR